LLSPYTILPALATSGTVYGVGGTKKSLLLTAVPTGVLTLMRPDVLAAGTVVAMLVLVADVIEE
jgi:hypothetical protein